MLSTDMKLNKKYGAVIVFYEPKQGDIDNSIKTINKFPDVEFIFVDNSPLECHVKWPSKVRSLSNYNKGGIAGAFNKGIDYLVYERGCDYVCTFDQDTKIPDNFFSSMFDFIGEHHPAVVCPNFYDINSKTFSNFIHLKNNSFSIVNESNRNDNLATFAISSGMFISKDVIEKVGSFDEDLFIDHVDTDYCFRVWKCGFNLYVNFDVCIFHSIGERTKHKLLGVTIKATHHNPLRRYYISRNGLYLSLKYIRSCPVFLYINTLRMIHEMLGIVFYEKNKLEKILSIFKGFISAIKMTINYYKGKK